MARGGLWQSENGGIEWEGINQRLSTTEGANFVPVDIQTIDPAGDTLIVRTSSATLWSYCWFSFDGGNQWQHIPDNISGGNIEDFLLPWRMDHSIWFYLTANRFYMSRNYGAPGTWSRRGPDSGFGSFPTGLFQDPFRDSTLFCTSYFHAAGGWIHGGLCRSDDLGESWRTLIDFSALFGENDADVYSMARLSNDDLFALGTGSTTSLWENGTVLISTDDGVTWVRNYGGLPDRFQPEQVIEDQFQPGTLFVRGGQKYGLYWSHDYGRTWQHCMNGLPGNVCFVNHLYQNPFSGTIYASVTGWGVFKTTDHGQSWQPLPMPDVGPLGDLGVTEETVFVRDDGYRQWRLDPGVEDWQEMSYPVAEDTLTMMRPVCYHSGDTLVSALWKRPISGPATDHLQMIYSYDNGATWELDPFLPILPQFYFRTHQSSRGVRFTSFGSSEVYISRDLGRTWFTSPLPDGYRTEHLAMNDSVIYVAAIDWATLQLEIFRSNDEGSSWNSLDLSASFDYTRPLPTLIGDELFVNNSGQCWRWQAGEWETRGEIPNHEDLDWLLCVPRDPPVLFGLSYSNNDAWVSEDSGWTWRQPVIEPPYSSQSFSFTDVKYDAAQHRIWAISGLGACYLDDAELSSAGPLIFQPYDYTVLAAYPNPFNGRTRILFDLKNSQRVQLRVFSVEGRLIRTLVDGVQQAGRHELDFSADALPSGVYFVQLQTPDRNKTEKIVLLR
ncbi:MAG: T9SS type A sorting domain-containing protein [bacterium]|nr:T9SS type A sorting domain-containing protein [bacterium]